MQIYFHSRLGSYLPRVPILVEGTVELLTAEMFARQISGLSAHGTHMSLVGRMTGVQKKVGRTRQKVEKPCCRCPEN